MGAIVETPQGFPPRQYRAEDTPHGVGRSGPIYGPIFIILLFSTLYTRFRDDPPVPEARRLIPPLFDFSGKF